jgi:hypothetical protein
LTWQGLPTQIADSTPKNGLFQNGFSFKQKYLLGIQNRCLAFWMVHLEDPERKIISFSRGIIYGSPNMAGVYQQRSLVYNKN